MNQHCFLVPNWDWRRGWGRGHLAVARADRRASGGQGQSRLAARGRARRPHPPKALVRTVQAHGMIVRRDSGMTREKVRYQGLLCTKKYGIFDFYAHKSRMCYASGTPFLPPDAMDRLLYDDLLAWKRARARKPVLIDGARQTGKTYLVERLFGARQFRRIHKLDFNLAPRMASVFADGLAPRTIVDNIEVQLGRRCRPDAGPPLLRRGGGMPTGSGFAQALR